MGRGVSRRRSCRGARPGAGGAPVIAGEVGQQPRPTRPPPRGELGFGGGRLWICWRTDDSATCIGLGRGKPSPAWCPERGKGQGSSSGLTAITRSRRVQTKTPWRSPGPGLGSAGPRLPGKGLHRHIGRVCSIGWCWDAPAPVLELCPHAFCSFQSRERGEGGLLLRAWLSGMAEPQGPTGCHRT